MQINKNTKKEVIMSIKGDMVDKLKRIIEPGLFYDKSSLKILMKHHFPEYKALEEKGGEKAFSNALQKLKEDGIISYDSKNQVWTVNNDTSKEKENGDGVLNNDSCCEECDSKHSCTKQNDEELEDATRRLRELFNQHSLNYDDETNKYSKEEVEDNIEDIQKVFRDISPKNHRIISQYPPDCPPINFDLEQYINSVTNSVAEKAVNEKVIEKILEGSSKIIEDCVKKKVEEEFRLNIVPSLMASVKNHIEEEVKEKTEMIRKDISNIPTIGNLIEKSIDEELFSLVETEGVSQEILDLLSERIKNRILKEVSKNL